MMPKILEYEDGRVKVTAEAYAIPEIKALIDKYDMQAEPYLSYIYSMTAPDSPYINLPDSDRSDTIIYDIVNTLGEFHYSDPLIQNALDKLKSLYVTPLSLLADELAEELHRMRKELRNTPIEMSGENENFRSRMYLLEKIEKISSNYTKIRKQADEEQSPDTRGDHEVGDY